MARRCGPLTHSRDFAVAFVALFGEPRTLGQAFHITADEALPWNWVFADERLNALIDRLVSAYRG